jgi:hypothetical protein
VCILSIIVSIIVIHLPAVPPAALVWPVWRLGVCRTQPSSNTTCMSRSEGGGALELVGLLVLLQNPDTHSTESDIIV